MQRAAWIFVLAGPALWTSCGDESSSAAATAAGHSLTVDEVVAMLAADDRIPVNDATLLQLAELWIDFTLLSEAVAEDPSLSQLDLTPVVRQRVEQEMVLEFRRSLVELDTALSDAELRRRYAAEATDSEVRLSHILLAWPPSSSPGQADSVRAEAARLRQRIVDGGEDFAELARAFSDDPENGPEGGDTGYFGPGEKIVQIEAAAFTVEPGTVSWPFESELGVHIIRVDDRRTPSLATFRERLQRQRTTEAEARIVVELVADANAEPADGAVQIVRRLAREPRAPMDDVPEDHALVEYDGGAVTVAEIRQLMLSRTARFRTTVANDSEQDILQRVLGTMLQGEVLVAEARARGIEIPDARRASIEEEVRTELRETARLLGLLDGGSGDLQDAARAAVTATLRDEVRTLPLGASAYVLSLRYPSAVNRGALERAGSSVTGLRSLT